MDRVTHQWRRMSTGLWITFLLWALPASIGVFLTCCEQRKAGHGQLWNWGTAGGILICLLWPVTLPVLLVIFMLHEHVLIVLNGTADGRVREEADRDNDHSYDTRVAGYASGHGRNRPAASAAISPEAP